MVRREIGPLMGDDKFLTQLRETVLAHLTNRMNVEAAAAQLFVHKNTVRYRLARAEELLGHPLADRAATLELALRHVSLFGSP
ncbi:helix-turn-helix domain-containing protein [Nocardioides alcanivorans]|uniref:helix-turn-helix domain-containing protein n=1 Tax=Nocardioides alcanivorans TaxID=2897352 RepID=UPI001F357CCC|nr:helix-turn-helix domain-containing protein [Nocardioides alcanivorans]